MEKLARSVLVSAVLLQVACTCPKPPGGTDADYIEPDSGIDAGICKVGDPPVPSDCESGCVRPCLSDDVLGVCQPSGGPCTTAHAEVRCVAPGVCGPRGPCEPDYFDFDPTIPGCETHCVNRKCDLGDGGSITLNNDPLHERSAAFHALSSGGSFGDLTMTSDGGAYQNVGVLGEVAAGTSSSDGGYTNYGGFMSVGRGPASQRR